MLKLCLATLLALALLPAQPAAARGDRPGTFDHYVLALSWSPTYCASEAGRDDRQQCGSARPYAFVIHGLWPQWQRGWPEHCATTARWLAEEVLADALAFMPSRRLVIQQWKKHGTCTGLTQQAYFDLTQELYAKLVIPPRYRLPTQAIEASPGELRQDFLDHNPGLTPAMLSIQCGNRRDGGRLEELRVCFGRDLAFTPCGANERRQCRASRLILPPVR